MKFSFPDRVRLAHVPTPVSKLERLSQELAGPQLFIKRDDLTGFGVSGNKVRKLEFSAAEALHQGAGVLITCGGLQSNHARAVAVVAAQLGIKSHLVLRGEAGGVADGNLLIDKIVGAELTYITPDQYYHHIDAVFADIAKAWRKKGKNAYIIPEGASNAIGAMGYLHAGQEILDDEKKLGVQFDYIVCAVGSGGTYAGLLLATKLFGLKAQVVGINVCDDEEYFIRRISGIVTDVRDRFNINFALTRDDIHIIDGYVGQGYALSRPEEIELIKKVGQTEGILLDPVYTGKTMYGLVDLIRKHRFNKNDTILFLHSGGGFGLFPVKEMFV